MNRRAPAQKPKTSIGTWIVVILLALLAIPAVGMAIWVALEEQRSMAANEAFADGVIHDMRWQQKTGTTRAHYRPQIVFWTESGQRIDLDLYGTDDQDRSTIGNFVRLRYDAMDAGNASVVGTATGHRVAGTIVDYEQPPGRPETNHPVVEFTGPDGAKLRFTDRHIAHPDLSRKGTQVEVAWTGTPSRAIVLTP